MSMSLVIVLALNQAPDAGTWQRTLAASGLPASFTAAPNLQTHRGFLPTRVHGRPSGFYFLRESFEELARNHAPLSRLTVSRPVVYSLGYGGDGLECASAFYSASVLVGKFGGVAFDPQANSFFSESELVEAAAACVEIAD